MASNQNDQKSNNPQAQDKQQQQSGQRNQPGQQDRQNVNQSSDAQLNQGQGNQRQGQHGSAQGQQGKQQKQSGNQTERDENMLNLKPTCAPRARMFSRLACAWAGVMPYFSVMCSVISWPSGAILGLSSKGWKCSSAWMSPRTRSSAWSSDFRPMTHQGQETSDTKSILSWVVMSGVCP